MTDMDTKQAATKRIATALVCQPCWISYFILSEWLATKLFLAPINCYFVIVVASFLVWFLWRRVSEILLCSSLMLLTVTYWRSQHVDPCSSQAFLTDSRNLMSRTPGSRRKWRPLASCLFHDQQWHSKAQIPLCWFQWRMGGPGGRPTHWPKLRAGHGGATQTRGQIFT